MSKQKQQGTAHETNIVKRLNNEGMPARRLPELGSNDEGDIEFKDSHGVRWIVEAKATERLNVTRVLGKAREKSGIGKPTVLVWKRLVKTGKKVRQSDGEKEVVVMTFDDFVQLVGR